jgi:hypothetical protein
MKDEIPKIKFKVKVVSNHQNQFRYLRFQHLQSEVKQDHV